VILGWTAKCEEEKWQIRWEKLHCRVHKLQGNHMWEYYKFVQFPEAR